MENKQRNLRLEYNIPGNKTKKKKLTKFACDILLPKNQFPTSTLPSHQPPSKF